MPVFCEVSLDKSFKKNFLESLLKDWGISGEYKNKDEIVQVLRGSFGSIKPHVRIYLISHDEKLYGVSGERPTADPVNTPRSISSFIQKFKKDPESLNSYINDPTGLITDDPKVNLKVKQLVAGEIQADDLNLLLKDVAAVLTGTEAVDDGENSGSEDHEKPDRVPKSVSEENSKFWI